MVEYEKPSLVMYLYTHGVGIRANMVPSSLPDLVSRRNERKGAWVRVGCSGIAFSVALFCLFPVYCAACPRNAPTLPVLDDVWPHVSAFACSPDSDMPKAALIDAQSVVCSVDDGNWSPNEASWLKSRVCQQAMHDTDGVSSMFPFTAHDVNDATAMPVSAASAAVLTVLLTKQGGQDGADDMQDGSFIPTLETNDTFLMETSVEMGETTAAGVTVTVQAASVFGIRRGVVALSQLVMPIPADCVYETSASDDWVYVMPLSSACSSDPVPVQEWNDDLGRSDGAQSGADEMVWSVQHKARFPWRGLMVDGARHFMSIASLENILDIMSSSDLNVMHLHLVDAISFPFVPPSHPDLGIKGAFDAKHATYSAKDLAGLVSYAADRGIRLGTRDGRAWT